MSNRTCPRDGATLELNYRAPDGFSYHSCPTCRHTYAGLFQSWSEG